MPHTFTSCEVIMMDGNKDAKYKSNPNPIEMTLSTTKDKKMKAEIEYIITFRTPKTSNSISSLEREIFKK